MSISVCVATYNGEKYITEQINSILNQIGNYDQIVISDDCSTDKTCEIVKAVGDSRIILIENKETIGVIRNFEKSLERVKGNYIFLCDQDDIWKPDKVKVCLEYLNIYDIVVSDCEIIDEKENVVLGSYFSRRKSGKGFFKNLWANTYLGCCIAFKKEILDIALPFPSDIPMHDIWFGFIGEAFFKTHFIEEQLVSYRMHNQNISPTTVGISPHNLFSRLGFRWNIAKYFPLIIYRKWKTWS